MAHLLGSAVATKLMAPFGAETTSVGKVPTVRKLMPGVD